MNKFYFTFGTNEEFPYRGGWVEVFADNLKHAISKFRTRFPDRHKGIVNCAFWYTEEQWGNTIMTEGNMGANCHEVIS
jgi:hypothetical protein